MMIETTRFGMISIDDACVITFPEGLPGFEGCRRYTLVPHPSSNSPFEWLQSIDDGGLAFLTMDPRLAFPQYDPRLPAAELQSVALERIDREGARLYALLTVPKGDPSGITANLLAPIIVNEYAKLGKQIIASGDDYGLRHRLLPN